MEMVILTCDDLIFRFFVLMLEYIVTEGAGKRKIAVDAIELNPAAALDDPLGLRLVIGLVVQRQDLQLSVHAGNGARVACVGAIKLVVLYQNHYGSRAGHLVTTCLVA